MNEGLKNYIEDLRCELEELNECGDLEERMEAAQKLSHFENLLSEKEGKNEEAQHLECGLCHGSGKHSEYGDTWDCPPCSGRGGTWV